ncbi:MAG TPA: L,D-transpeptidase [Gemmatimonadota bacterium]|nr:L,D-transpeptidase [Gemmatimonadota bacterium]
MRIGLAIVAVSGLLLSASSVRGQGSKAPEADPVSLLVSVSERLLTVQRGDEVLFQFPVGVGTGERLNRTRGEEWVFSTPTGAFEIGRKKKDPVWYTPDWYYVERGQPIPVAYSDVRYRRGVLGDYALYLSDEIAIHGTENESTVGRASSHGCLRMRNTDIAVVFPLVEVGTRVVIVP